MPSCSADGAAGAPPEASRGRWHRLLVVVLLAAAALTGPAVEYASARFGDTATVTISVTVGPTPSPSPSGDAGPAAPADGPVTPGS